jgi:hypothetical protein
MLAIALLLALQSPIPTDSVLAITTATNTVSELQTKAQLERLLTTFDPRPWQFTSRVVIDASAIPFSHPRLTLSTRHVRDDELLLSTYLHEQLHWYLARHDSAGAAAVRELRQLFPSIPTGYPEGGSDETGNYYHLIVIYLEDRANRLVQGELRAQQIMSFWAGDHYTWLYRAVRDRNRAIGEIVRKHGLLYPARSSR